MNKSAEIQQHLRQLSDDAVSILRELVRIPSITGDELAVQKKFRELLTARQLDVDEWNPTREQIQTHPAFSDDELPLGKRPVIVARWKGSGGGRSLILNGHVDVVPPGDLKAWTDSPWSGSVQDRKLYGRGSCDMKGGIVSGLLAIDILRRMDFQPRGDVLVECVIGEETGGVGTLATILKGYTADAAIVLEPTRLQLCPVGAGAASFRLHVPGKAAHGAMRLEGISSIEKFYPLFNALMQFEQERNSAFVHPLFQKEIPAPISIGRISAGDWPSTVPEALVAEGRYGVLPGEQIAEAREKFEQKIREVCRQDSWLSKNQAIVEWFEGQFESAETPLDSEFLRILSDSHQKMLLSNAKAHGVPYGSDLRFFTNYARIPAVLYGPGDVAQAHTVNEFIAIQEVFDAAMVVAHFIMNWCGPGKVDNV